MKHIPFFLISLLIYSCELSSTEPLIITSEEVLNYQKEIIQLSESISCTDASEWKFAPMGSKACGGPIRYIAYHQRIEQAFLDLVERFTTLQKTYNEQNKVVSDCLLVGPPLRVQCEGNKAILVY
ncbi:MAG: hypothetical protein NWR70_04350 [Algoriphagus sp.]|jgi:hypothetical protein|uniref:hypothetical protein n=1 Tax=Algoriphagus sp. TaxID=1872435 RepID=UPI00276F7054|nr:hypothetical protein [Algoriphagus sp.]MDP4838776.1 hypothetical protein [Algoriphagus sp.]MDP5126178.1 hypothetical protein [Algoriphagus sp.]